MSEGLRYESRNRPVSFRERKTVPKVSAVLLASALFPAQVEAQNTNVPTLQTIHEFTDADRGALKVAAERPGAQAFRSYFQRFPKKEVDLAAIQNSSVPILVPTSNELHNDMNIFFFQKPYDYHYLATAGTTDFSVEIHGTRKAFSSPTPTQETIPPLSPQLLREMEAEDVLTKRLRGSELPAVNTVGGIENVSFLHAHGSVGVSFTRFGTLYLVDAECLNPNDKRCTELGVLQIARGLELVGGGK